VHAARRREPSHAPLLATRNIARDAKYNSDVTNDPANALHEIAPPLADLKKLPMGQKMRLLLARLPITAKVGLDMGASTPKETTLAQIPQKTLKTLVIATPVLLVTERDNDSLKFAAVVWSSARN
jgi:hypothetical protein